MAPTNPAAFLDLTMTTLIIGPKKRKYIIHKELLREKLGYFKTAYTTETVETSSNVFEMDDSPDRAVRSLIAWLYTGRVFLDPGNTDALDEDSDASDASDASDDSEDESTCGNAYREWEEASSMEDLDQQDEGQKNPNSADQQEDKQADREEEGEGEGEGEVDYEYDSGSEPDDTESDKTNGGGDRPPSAPGAKEDQEERLIKAISPDPEPSELDAYQIGVLIQVHSSEQPISDPTYVPKWKLALEQTREGVQGAGDESLGLDIYDGLVDLYIVGYRFDCCDLCVQVVTLLETEQRAQSEMLNGQALPSFQTVSKAFESLPPVSMLRQWLLHIFANHWRPSGDSADQVAARDLLPKDFLLALALTAAERIHFSTGGEDFPSWRSLWIDHDYIPAVFDPVWQNRGR